MKTKKIINDLKEIQESTKRLVFYEEHKLGLDTWVIGMIDLVIQEMEK